MKKALVAVILLIFVVTAFSGCISIYIPEYCAPQYVPPTQAPAEPGTAAPAPSSTPDATSGPTTSWPPESLASPEPGVDVSSGATALGNNASGTSRAVDANSGATAQAPGISPAVDANSGATAQAPGTSTGTAQPREAGEDQEEEEDD